MCEVCEAEGQWICDRGVIVKVGDVCYECGNYQVVFDDGYVTERIAKFDTRTGLLLDWSKGWTPRAGR